MTQIITDDDFESKVLEAPKPTLVDFWAEWCGPCKQIAPILEEISDEMSSTLSVAKINIDDNPMTPSQFGVRSIPTLILFKDGEAAAIKIGTQSKNELVQWIKESV